MTRPVDDFSRDKEGEQRLSVERLRCWQELQ